MNRKSTAIAAAFGALVLVPLVLWAATSQSGGAEELTIEVLTGPGGVELTALLPGEEINTLDTTDGDPTVELECLDDEGEVISSSIHPWPFTDTDEGTLPPHVHEPVSPEQVAARERCRLKGTEPELEGPVPEQRGL